MDEKRKTQQKLKAKVKRTSSSNQKIIDELSFLMSPSSITEEGLDCVVELLQDTITKAYMPPRRKEIIADAESLLDEAVQLYKNDKKYEAMHVS